MGASGQFISQRRCTRAGVRHGFLNSVRLIAHVRYRGICWEQKDSKGIVHWYLCGGTVDGAGRRCAWQVRVMRAIGPRGC